MLDPHSLEVLEFPKIVALVASGALTPYGHELCERIEPLFIQSDIDRLQKETSELQDILEFGQPFPLSHLEDCRPLLSRAGVTGGFLEPDEFLILRDLLQVSSDLHRYEKDNRDSMRSLDNYLSSLKPCADLLKKIDSTIDERGDIRDNASKELKRIRGSLAGVRRRIITRLEQIVSGRRNQPGWQDDVVTIRSGRYVIPVLAKQYKRDMGILHDRSQSGNTLFIEPPEALEFNNQLNLLKQQERLEMDRILRRLTEQVSEREDALRENCSLIGHLDRLHAAAQFSLKIKASRPGVTSQSKLTLVDARHPLLIAFGGSVDAVVPLSITLDEDRRALLVTGPNTGGKTVALKTCGLLLLMAQSGLPVPANPKSEIGIFNKLYADIGDEQSIEQSLSTFSSHLKNIVEATRHADGNTLVLLDEVGAGTDPKEGAALAESIVLHLLERRAKLIVTTHYSQLKTLPLEHEGIENASMEFDRTTLSPTFRLQAGIPGSSYAVEIARRLGMTESICVQATSLMDASEKSLTSLIESLESELSQIRADRTELSERLAKAKELEQFYRTQRDKLTQSAGEEREKSLREAKELIDDARRKVERLVGDIRKSDASKKAVKDWHSFLKKTKSHVERQIESIESSKSRPDVVHSFMKGDIIRVISLNQQGEIEEILSGDRARVQIGSMNMTTELRNLEKLSAPLSKGRVSISNSVGQDTDLSPEIHLRGMTVEEALESLEKYMDKAVVAGLGQIYVIHGKGTGTLRRVLSDYLRNHREVDSLQIGNWNEGGAGVTVVKLKT